MHIPKGYRFGGVSASFKKPGKLDLGAIVTDLPAVAAGVFTTNKFQAAPVLQCKELLEQNETFHGFVANSGQANACTGDEGRANCMQTLMLAGRVLYHPADTFLPASTGVIGAQFDLNKWIEAMPKLAEAMTEDDPELFAKAIMTTDTVHKIGSTKVTLSGGDVSLLGMCKGSGMISPNMATMLSFVVCDAKIEREPWQAMLKRCVDKTMNRVTVDGDMSTNDCTMALANGAAEVSATSEADMAELEKGLLSVLEELAYLIAMDAEGGTKVAIIEVNGANSDDDAEKVARAVGNSPLVKTALFGSDPNWGRIVCAAGYSGADFKAEDLKLRIGDILIFENGTPAPGDMDDVLAPIMAERDIVIGIELGDGPGVCRLLASDLTRDYISINADYRS